MRWITFKVISFISIFTLNQTLILPWLTSHNLMPTWCTIILISIGVVATMDILDRIVLRFIDVMNENSEMY